MARDKITHRTIGKTKKLNNAYVKKGTKYYEYCERQNKEDSFIVLQVILYPENKKNGKLRYILHGLVYTAKIISYLHFCLFVQLIE